MRSDSCYTLVKQFVSLHACHGATRWIGLGQAMPIGRLILGLLRLELTVSPS